MVASRGGPAITESPHNTHRKIGLDLAKATGYQLEVNLRNAGSDIWEKLAETGAEDLRKGINMHRAPEVGVSQLLETQRRRSATFAVQG
jgi:tRNA(Leu) C34 or U34 (ribose-2'-O)-methylase TrmL